MHYATRCILKNLSNMAWFIQTLFSLLGLVSVTWLKVTESAKTSSVKDIHSEIAFDLCFWTLSIGIFFIQIAICDMYQLLLLATVCKKILMCLQKRFCSIAHDKINGLTPSQLTCYMFFDTLSCLVFILSNTIDMYIRSSNPKLT